MSIAYQVFGRGHVDLLFTPGFVSNVEMWWSEPNFVRFFERLGRFARVMIFDKRGTGLSDPVTGPPTLDERADDVQAVLDAAGSERAWIMGVSEGGAHGIVFATTRPERVAGLVLYGVFVARDREGVPPVFRDDENWEVFFDATEHWGEGRSLRIFYPPAVGRPLQQRFWALWERTGGSRAMARQLYDLMWNLDVSDIVSHVSVPTLVLHFENDFIDVANARWIAGQIPGARLVTFPDGAHVPLDVRSIDLMADEMERFITGSLTAFEPERVLASVLFTDIVGSTERSVAVGEVEWRRTVDAHDRLFRELLVEHRGNEIKTMGDGFLATFDSPVRAVRCARSFVLAVHDLGISVRAGIHTGEIDLVGDDVGGLGVVIAARVSALAGAGEVLATKTVRDLTTGSNLAYRARGDQVLKGVPGTWPILEVVDERAGGCELLATSEPSPHLHGRLLERIAYRAPRLARLGVHASRAFPRS